MGEARPATKVKLESPSALLGSGSSAIYSCQGRSGVGRANISTNVVVLFRMQELSTMSAMNFRLAILALFFAGVNIVLLILNYLSNEHCSDPPDITARRCGSPVSVMIFHRLEFWATFCYSLIEALSLVYTPKSLFAIYSRYGSKPVCFSIVPVNLHHHYRIHPRHGTARKYWNTVCPSAW